MFKRVFEENHVCRGGIGTPLTMMRSDGEDGSVCWIVGRVYRTVRTGAWGIDGVYFEDEAEAEQYFETVNNLIAIGSSK